MASSSSAPLIEMEASQPPALPAEPPLVFPFASQADVIRAEQKDAYVKYTLREMVKDVYGSVFGTRNLLTNLPVLSTASDAAYYVLTTLAGNQTLGEEYTEILPMSAATEEFPSLPRRAAWIGFHVLAPFFFGRVVTRAVRENQMGGGYLPERPRIANRLPDYKDEDRDGFQDADQEPMVKMTLSSLIKERLERMWRYFVRYAPSLQRFLSNEFRALHLAIFYFLGAYYNVANRILRIRYIFTRQLAPNEQPISYEFLGLLIAVQLAVSLYLRLRGSKTVLGGDPESAEEDADREEAQGEQMLLQHMEKLGMVPVEQKKCTLCLEPRKVPTSTPCGHVFCWKCIGDWCQNKPECPLCRQDINPSHLLPLFNYA